MMSRYRARAESMEHAIFIKNQNQHFTIFSTCEHVLLGGDGVLVAAPHHHLGVVHQVEGEEDGPGASVHHLHVLGVRDEDHHDPEDHQPHQQAHQDPAHRCEVPLGLKIIVSMKSRLCILVLQKVPSEES